MDEKEIIDIKFAEVWEELKHLVRNDDFTKSSLKMFFFKGWSEASKEYMKKFIDDP